MKQDMPRWALSMTAAVLLASCGEQAPAPQPATAQAAVSSVAQPQGPLRTVLAFGDSLYAGYGVAQDRSYPARLEQALWANGINAKVVNGGVSGDTTAAGLQRLKFTLDNQKVKPDLMLIGLGGNDMLRGLAPAQVRQNLDAMLAEAQRRGIPVLLTGMLAAPNLGADYGDQFNAIYPDLARKYDAALVPFFLDGVLGNPALMQGDNVHPTAEGIETIVGATVDKVAESLPSGA